MATNYDAAVNSFYLAYYGRPADPAGLAYWSQALAQNNGDFSAIIDAFSTSAEATTRFGNATPGDRIADVYQQLFNRKPDAAGLEYWTKAIESGTISIADAAIQIMNGAQSTDAQLSTLRQEAAAQFTAEVAASGTAYDGAAAVEAARVLIAAITPESSATDIKTLVTATKSLVQTVHDNPDVITALAGSGSLATLLTSAGGKADPVAMVQALASVGKAASSDPGALATLKQGGGMAGLVDNLPAGASLQDVAQAADKGGLAAVTDIVKPAPADTTPPAAPKVALVADTGVSADDHLTNNGQVKVSGLEAGSTWQYSFDGKTWQAGPVANAAGVALLNTTATGDQTLQVRSTDAAGNVSAVATLQYTLKTSFAPTLAFQGPDGNDTTSTALVTNTDNYWVNLHGAKGAAAVGFQVSDSGTDGTWTDAKDSDPLADGTHFIRYVVTDAAGNTAPSNALKLVMNHALPGAPGVQLAQDTGASATDHVTSNGQVNVTGLDAGAAWSYSTDDGKSWTAGPAANTGGTAQLDLGAGQHHLLVRTFETVDGTPTFSINALDYTVSTDFKPTLAFRAGADGADLTTTKLLTNTDDYWVSLHGGKDASKVIFQVSDTGKDGTWAEADPAAPLSDGAHFIRYVVTDLAGNTGTTNALEVDMDKTAPAAPKVAFVNDTGASATDHVTTSGQIQVSGIEAGATWQYTDDGTHWITGATPDTDGNATAWLTNGQHTLQVRVVDAAGNTAVTTMPYTLESAPPAAGLAFDHVAGGAQGGTQTTLAKADLVFTYTGTVDAGASVSVQYGAGGFVGAANATIDTAAKTVTLHDVDLTTSDPYVTVGITSLGGGSTYSIPVKIDGPYVEYAAQATDAGIALSSAEGGHVYLASTQVGELGAGAAVIGVQAAAAQGVLGVGPSATVHTDNGIVYGLGTTGADTLAGQYAWGYDGDDHITALGTADNRENHVTSAIYGGNGADTIDATAGSSTFVYRGVQESTIVADGQAAHGFDVINVGTGSVAQGGHMQVFDFGVKIDGFYTESAHATLAGTETGTDLLALINGAVHFQGAGKPEAAYVDFSGAAGTPGVHFLVVDTDGNGKIDAADYAVKIVGTLDLANSFVTAETGHMLLTTA